VYEFRLPDLGEGIHEGEILEWHVAPGDAVREDDPLVDIETDKAAVTIPSPRAGRLVSIGAAVGEVATVGGVIAVIDDGTARESAPAPEGISLPAVQEEEKPETVTRREATVWGPVTATPATRRLARELKVDISRVPPMGPGGRVTAEDVARYAGGDGRPVRDVEPSTGAVPAVGGTGSGIPFFELEPLPDFEQWGPVEKTPLRSIRRRVARKMTTSMVMVPHVAHMDEADVTGLEAFRRRERDRSKGGAGFRLTLLPFVLKAVAEGLKGAPALNASLDPFREELIFKKYYHIGIAVDTDKGLMVPVIRDTDRRSVREIAHEIERLVGEARSGSVAVGDLRGGTFSVTNLGPLGGTGAIPTINYPEVAILAMGRVHEKPVVRDGQIVVRAILPLTLAFDHRVIDGADAARFVSALVNRLSDPLTLLLDA